MNIGLYQYHIVWEDKRRNLNFLKEVLEKNAKDIDVLLLPEMSFTGFSMRTSLIGEENYETVEEVKEMARNYHTAIGFGWVKHKRNSENHYTVVSEKGEVLSDYIKIHPFSYGEEDLYYHSGREIVKFQLSGMTFSAFICYDLRFPELFRIAAKKCDVIFVPANWPTARREHWKCLLQARALENQIYILGINCVGDMNGSLCAGDSCVIAPDGSIREKLGDEEGLLTFELKNDVWQYRDSFPTFRDRREELYIKLLQQESMADG